MLGGTAAMTVVGRAVTLLAQIADALAEARAKGIVHRDIKPANVMLLKGDRVKVLDFGIARYTEQTTDLTGSALIGTPAFMAPEQFDRNEGVDHRTDLYALGALAYELLTGRRPFTADAVRRLLHDVLFTPAPAVRDTHLQERLPGGEVPVQGGRADSGAAGDLLQGGVGAALGDERLGGGDDPVDVAAGVGPHPPGRRGGLFGHGDS
ncbi:hypothetical protein GCM10010182_46030 [Actinomadura cremea]|nr:hypothetical protein GCM10010182_46030 [Actinomadura cremea]